VPYLPYESLLSSCPLELKHLSSHSFLDVADNHWARSFIESMYIRGVVTGYNNNFDPNGPTTISQFLAMAMRVADIRLYADVQGIHWARQYIHFGLEYDFFTHINPDITIAEVHILPPDSLVDAPITREQAFYLLYRVLSSPHASGTWNRVRYNDPNGINLIFHDADDISDPFLHAIEVLFQVDVVTGRPNLTLSPTDEITRAEVTALLFNAITPPGSVALYRHLPMCWVNNLAVLDPNRVTINPNASDTRRGKFNEYGMMQHGFTAPRTELFKFSTYSDMTTYAPIIFQAMEDGNTHFTFEFIRPEWASAGVFMLEENSLFVVESMGIPDEYFYVTVAQVPGYIPNTVLRTGGFLMWPTTSREVTLWYGQLDHLLPNAYSPALNIQNRANNQVFSIADGVISNIASGRVYVDFRLNGAYKQVVYGNVTLDSLSVGNRIRRGQQIGTMERQSLTLGNVSINNAVMELEIWSNNQTVNPAQFFDFSGMPNEFLSVPMASFFMHHAGITPSFDGSCIHTNFAHNLGLVEEQMYLRRYVEWMFNINNLSAEGYKFEDVFLYCPVDDTFTVSLFDETNVFIALELFFEAYEDDELGGFEAFSDEILPAFQLNNVVPLAAVNRRPAPTVVFSHFARFSSTHSTGYDLELPIEQLRGPSAGQWVTDEVFYFEGRFYSGVTFIDNFTARYGFTPDANRYFTRNARASAGQVTVDKIHRYTRKRGFNMWVDQNRLGQDVRVMTYATNPATDTVRLYFGESNNNPPARRDSTGWHENIVTFENLTNIRNRIRANDERMPRVMINAGFFTMNRYRHGEDKSMGWAFSSYNNFGMYDFGVNRWDINRPVLPNNYYFHTLFYYGPGFYCDDGHPKPAEILHSYHLTRACVEARAENAIFIITGTIDATGLPNRYSRGDIDTRQRWARSMIGVRPDGSIIFLAVDSGVLGDRFATTVPHGDSILRSMGAAHVLNLDGGWSTQFFLDGEEKTFGPSPTERRQIGSVFKIY